MIRELDRIIKRSLRQLAEDTHVWNWRAKERDWVNYFAHRHLIGHCSRRGPLKEPAQICIEVSVKQPSGRTKPAVSRDLVIWRKCGEVAFVGDGDNCFDRNWKPANHPIAILEWKVHRPGRPNREVEKERQWLRDYCKDNSSVLAYAIEIDMMRPPTLLRWFRFLGSTEKLRPHLTLATEPSDRPFWGRSTQAQRQIY